MIRRLLPIAIERGYSFLIQEDGVKRQLAQIV
jgi:hypothetical protein